MCLEVSYILIYKVSMIFISFISFPRFKEKLFYLEQCTYIDNENFKKWLEVLDIYVVVLDERILAPGILTSTTALCLLD